MPGRQEIGVSGNSLHENAGKELTGEGQDPSPSIFFISLLETQSGHPATTGPDHLSAYALIVEEGTRLAARMRRGELPRPDDDVLADRYVMADELLSKAGSRGVAQAVFLNFMGDVKETRTPAEGGWSPSSASRTPARVSSCVRGATPRRCMP